MVQLVPYKKKIWIYRSFSYGIGGPKYSSLAFLPSAGLQSVCGSSSVAGERLRRPSLILVAVLGWRLMPTVTQRQLKRAIKLAHRQVVRLGHWKYLQKGDNISCRVQLNTYWCPLHSAWASGLTHIGGLDDCVGIDAHWWPWRLPDLSEC